MEKGIQRVVLYPDLTDCIETIARREYSRVFKQLLTPDAGNEELEEKLEILRLFLEKADFKQLRAESEKKLMEGKRVSFIVYRDNGLRYEIKVTWPEA